VRRIWEILRREYLENVRTKAFLVGLVLTPVWMGVVFVVPHLISGPEQVTVVVVDATGEVAGPLLETLAGRQGPTYEVTLHPPQGAFDPDAEGETRVDRLKREAGAGAHYLVVVTDAVLEKRPSRKGEPEPGVFGPSSGVTGQAGRVLADAVTDIVTRRILEERGIAEETAELIQRPAVRFETVTDTGERASMLDAILPFLAVMLLYMGIVGISQMLISSTLEEKANRVYEVLLSSVSPFQLMAGKLLGICAVGFTLLALWSGGGLVAAALQGFGDVVQVAQLGWFVVYYVLGFLMIASLFVAIGSACNTIKEAQNLMAPLSIMLALPLVLALVSMSNPNGTVPTVASFIPPFTPFLMMARIAGAPPPPDWQLWATLVILLLATWLTIRLAARVFRVGILLYGQPPSLAQIARWMRARD
jgi:ABC-2 type transport system permease protein